jgi:hypothetical protein
MNIFTAITGSFGVLRKGREFVDSVKSGKQVAITATLGVLLAAIAPYIGGAINVHPWLAYFFTEQGIQMVGAVIAGVAGLVYHFGSSADRGLPAKPVDAAPVAGPTGGPSASEQGPSDPSLGSLAADASQSNTVRPASDPSNPSSGYLPG